MTPRAVWSGTLGITGANVLYALAQWLIVLAVARSSTLGDVGALGLAMAIASPLVLSVELEQRSLLASGTEFPARRMWRIRLVCVTAIAISAALLWASFGNGMPGADVLLAVLFLKLTESVSDLTYGLCVRLGKPGVMVRSILLRAAGLLIGVLTGLWMESLVTGLWLATFAAAGVVMMHDLPRFRADSMAEAADEPLGDASDRRRRASTSLRALLRLGIPLSITTVIASLNSNAPRYLLSLSWPLEAVGAYTLLYHGVVAVNTLVAALDQMYLPRLGASFAAGDRAAHRQHARRLLLLTLAIGSSALVAVAAIGTPMLGLVFGEEMRSHGRALVVVFAGALLAYLAMGYQTIAVARRQVTFQPFVVLAALVISVLAGVLLLREPPDPIMAAALVMLLGRLVQLLGNAWFVHRHQRTGYHPPDAQHT